MNDRHDDVESVAWSLLLDKEMMAFGPGIAAGAGTAPEPIPPLRTRTGRHVHVSADMRNGAIIQGLLCFRDGGRLVLAAGEPSMFVTFHTDDATSVAVAYVEPTPEQDTANE